MNLDLGESQLLFPGEQTNNNNNKFLMLLELNLNRNDVASIPCDYPSLAPGQSYQAS